MTKQQKNSIMLKITLSTIVIMLVVFMLHRVFDVFSMHLAMNNIGQLSDKATLIANILIAIPVLIFIMSLYAYNFVDKEHKQIPLLITLALTFASIGTIAVGNGMIEYHFSIFMVIAMIAYYDSVKMIWTSAIIFALHHFVGYFTVPELLCGTGAYHFRVLMIHAVFLIVTSLATSFMVFMNNKNARELEAENNLKKQQLDEVLSNLVTTMDQLKDTSDTLFTNVEDTMNTSNSINSMMNEVTEGSYNQSEVTNESSKALEEVAQGITEIANAAGKVSSQSTSTLEKAQGGEKSILRMTEQMNTINNSVENLASIIRVFSEKSKAIEEVIQIMSNISEQTNLLALNAAIEAARAGIHGKGFAVVAEEVRQLAEQSQESAVEISQLVQYIQQYTEKANEAMGGGLEEVKEGTEAVHDTGEVFRAILLATEKVNEEIARVSSIAQEVAASSEEVSASVEQVSEIAESTSGRTYKISQDVTKQNHHIKEIYKVSESLKGTTYQLQELISKFSKQ